MIKNFLNPEIHQNPINGSKIIVIVLKGWILLIGEASAVEGLQSTGLPCVFFYVFKLYLDCLIIRGNFFYAFLLIFPYPNFFKRKGRKSYIFYL